MARLPLLILLLCGLASLEAAPPDPRNSTLQQEKATLEAEVRTLTTENQAQRQQLEQLQRQIQELLEQQKALDGQIIDENQGL